MPRVLRPAPVLARIALAACIGMLSIGWHFPHAHAQSMGRPNTLASATGAAVHGLVIGIDHYKNTSEIDELAGAVADAKDLAQTMRNAGVGDLTVLLEQDATRANVTRAIGRLETAVGNGDLVIITFAGHGSQEPEHVQGSEPDGLDETFLLWGFGTHGADTRERLIDDEVYDWLSKLSAKGAHILFLADSCHGGGLTKSVDPRASRLRIRGQIAVSRPEDAGRGRYYLPRANDLLDLPHLPPDDDATRDLGNLTFIGAVEPDVLAPEIMIQGQSRGAASFALARALEGQADAEGNRDGNTTRAELLSFMRHTVRNVTQNWQNPILEPHLDAALNQTVFRNGPVILANDRPVAQPTSGVKVAVLAASGRIASGDSYSIVQPGSAEADITFDGAAGDFIDRSGSVLAFDSAPERLQSVADRVRAGRRLALMAGGRSLDVWLTPHEHDLAAGERFRLNIGGAAGRYLTLLNLAGDGKVQYLFPTGASDSQVLEAATSFDLVVLPPFGTDLMVVVATSKPAPSLRQKLKLLDGQWNSMAVAEIIGAELGRDDRLGLVSYSTRPTLTAAPRR